MRQALNPGGWGCLFNFSQIVAGHDHIFNTSSVHWQQHKPFDINSWSLRVPGTVRTCNFSSKLNVFTNGKYTSFVISYSSKKWGWGELGTCSKFWPIGGGDYSREALIYSLFFTKTNKLVLWDFLSIAKNQDCETALETNWDCKMHIATKHQHCQSREIHWKVCENHVWLLKDHSPPLIQCR